MLPLKWGGSTEYSWGVEILWVSSLRLERDLEYGWYCTQARNKVYTCIVSLRPVNLIYYQSRSPAELLKSSGLTQVSELGPSLFSAVLILSSVSYFPACSNVNGTIA